MQQLFNSQYCTFKQARQPASNDGNAISIIHFFFHFFVGATVCTVICIYTKYRMFVVLFFCVLSRAVLLVAGTDENRTQTRLH